MKLLMCPPTFYSIQYEINPWMDVANRTNRQRARSQWEFLRTSLQQLGVQVSVVRQKKGCPDMVFTANAGVVRGRTFVPSHFRFQERRGEEAAFIGYFRRQGYKIQDAAQGLFFEGEGDLLPYRDMLFGGFHFRSEATAHERVSAELGKRLVTLELRTSRFYHLDTCFLPLDDNSVLYYPQAFDAYGQKVIKRFIKNPIAVSRADAFQFACNGLRVGRTVILNQASRGLKQKLNQLGYHVLESPTSEFMKGGGSVKCLLLRL